MAVNKVQGGYRVEAIAMPHIHIFPKPTESGGIEWEEKSFEQVYGVKPARRRCLAAACNPRLVASTTIITIHDYYTVMMQNEDGDQVPVRRHITQAQFDRGMLTASKLHDVWFLFTQSGAKSGTYYGIEKKAISKLAHQFAPDQGAELAVYGGLLFSSLAGPKDEHDLEPYAFACVPEYDDYNRNGEDGNSAFPRRMWGKGACQFRGIGLDADRWPIALMKGIGVGIHGGDATLLDTPVINASQIKWEQNGQHTEWALIAKTPVNDYRRRAMDVTWQVPILLKANEHTISLVEKRVEAKVSELLSYLEPENRIKLLRRFGALKFELDGTLKAADRLVMDALRSNMPMCSQLFNKMGRFSVRHIISAAVSGGVHAFSYLLKMHSGKGKPQCEASEGLAVFGLPLDCFDQIAWYERDPRGLHKPEDAKQMTRDGDGDASNTIKDHEFCAALAEHHVEYHIGEKAKGQRSKMPLSPKTLFRKASDAYYGGVWVGKLETARVKVMAEMERLRLAIEAEPTEGNVAQLRYWTDVCSQIAEAAMKAPQLLKWDITGPNGEPFADWASFLLSQAAGLPEPAWWTMHRAAEQVCQKIYDLADGRWIIEEPVVVLDYAWNKAIRTVVEWAKEHPEKDLDLADLAEYALQVNPKLQEELAKDGKAMWAFRKARQMWYGYWARNYGHDDVDHEGFNLSFDQRCKDLGRNGVIHAMLWEPSESAKTDGFNFKWRAIGASGVSFTEILGFHPDVLEEIALHEMEMEVRREMTVAVLCARRSGS